MPDPRVPRLLDALHRPTTVELTRAPGRVNLIGDHTDYCEGFVLPMAIDLDCLVALSPGSDDRVHARSLELPGDVDVNAAGTDAIAEVEPTWGRFVAGTIQALHALGARIPPVEVAVSSTVPPGSGLSSSSALSVALTLALASAAGCELEPVAVARAALDGEVRATGVPGGLMDQLTSIFGRAGHVLLIDCRSLDVRPIPLPASLSIVVVHSGLPRTLAGSEYAQRRAACEAAAARLGVRALRDATLTQVGDDPIARHVVTENHRVLETVDALQAGDFAHVGELLLASHASLRDDFRVSTPELDLLVEMLVEHGAYGARLTGAGFGGCVVALTAPENAQTLIDAVTDHYQRQTKIEPSAFVVYPADGASRRSLSP